MSRLSNRMKHELSMLENDPPPGISCWRVDDKINELKASILGNEDTPFENGVFKLEISLTERYPFEPPLIKFVTPIYHPNIDSAGRICLDLLKMPPKGSWKPSLNISTILKSIQILMSDPNPNDPLMDEIATEFRDDKRLFLEKAKNWTLKYAVTDQTSQLKRKQSNNENEVVKSKILKEAN